MSEQVVAEAASFVVLRSAGWLRARCVCGSVEVMRDQGLGRASIGAWKSRHRDCHLTADRTDPTGGAAGGEAGDE